MTSSPLGVGLGCYREEPLELPAVEGPRPTAAEDGQLVAGLVHRPVAVESTGQGQRRAVRGVGRHQLRGGARAEAEAPGVSLAEMICITRRPFLPSATYANPLLLVKPIFTSWASSMAPPPSIHWSTPQLLGLLDVHDGHSHSTRGHVGVGAGQVEGSGAGEREHACAAGFWVPSDPRPPRAARRWR